MKSIVMALGMVAATVQAAHADACQERFTALYLQLDQGVPTKSLSTVAFKGAPASTNEFLYLSQDHYMTVPTSPAGPWVLGYNNALYQSADEGKTWEKIRDMETAQNADKARADKEANAATVRNTACSEEELDGETVDVVAADITVSQGMVTENRYTYWVRRSDGFIVKAVYDTKAPNFEMVTTQDIEQAPGLTLPMPE
ncbi:MAG: hypothetical protein JJ866_09595 [Roseibium sp.]|uniref:hypothetical protein n=1 Tax=Roseibium sp. TaxID=1936156 RepID=UPI001B06ADB4|nr:hypothetical protein [Roseibium sp.]MBO6892182.1 hypothetical protein [Roseibium sp.]MBO6931017.1 hypothetical protein [Roseibium sp.]